MHHFEIAKTLNILTKLLKKNSIDDRKLMIKNLNKRYKFFIK